MNEIVKDDFYVFFVLLLELKTPYCFMNVAKITKDSSKTLFPQCNSRTFTEKLRLSG